MPDRDVVFCGNCGKLMSCRDFNEHKPRQCEDYEPQRYYVRAGQPRPSVFGSYRLNSDYERLEAEIVKLKDAVVRLTVEPK